MKKKTIMIIAIVAIIAVAASVSFAAWSIMSNSENSLTVTVIDQINLTVEANLAKPAEKLAPTNGVIIESGSTYADEVSFGKFTADFKKGAATANVDSYKITLTIDATNAYIDYIFDDGTTKTTLNATTKSMDIRAGIEYTVTAKFNSAIDSAVDAIDFAGQDITINLVFNTVAVVA